MPLNGRLVLLWLSFCLRFAATVGQEVPCCAALRGVNFTSALPVVVIWSEGAVVIPDEPKVAGRLCTCADDGNYDGPVGIEIRGSTSARDFSKKSYAIETRDTKGNALDVGVLGLAADNDWVLYGPELDKSVGLRNALTLAMARELKGFAPEARFVEVFVVEEDAPLRRKHYRGLYLFMERIKREVVSRLGVDGFIVKHDNNNIDAGDRHFRLELSGLDIVVVYPKRKEVTNERMRDIKLYLDAFEEALFAAEPQFYGGFMDIDSFVDYFLITEITKNPDGYRGSTFMHRDKAGLLKMGPVWDYNEAFGMCCGYPIEGYLRGGRSYGVSGGSAISTYGWRFNICSDPARCIVDPLDGVSQWYRLLWQDLQFREAVRSRWRDLRGGPFTDESIQSMIRALRAEIELAAGRNNQRWAAVLGYSSPLQTLNEITAIETWTLARLAWMDAQLLDSHERSNGIIHGLEGFTG